MTIEQYVSRKASALARSQTREAANEVIRQIQTDLEEQDVSQATRRKVWRALKVQYEQEPKPFLKESISGRRLNELQQAVLQFLQRKSDD